MTKQAEVFKNESDWFYSLPLETTEEKVLNCHRTCQCGEIVKYDGTTPALITWITKHFEHRFRVSEDEILGASMIFEANYD